MSDETSYSALDRAIHRLAFASPAIQETAADIEAMLYGSTFRSVQVERPIFVTSLPRAGTTLVLELLAKVPGIATHNYRDMPFVLAPILWDAVSRGFRKPSALRERAHGDGMAVGYDSPEAFEEVLWRWHWGGKYSPEGIALWSDQEDIREFLPPFLDHIRKIIALRSGERGTRRYASKNNANIARLGLLRKMIPDAIILVPFRDPIGQAVSLLQQHRRFGALHGRDAFSKQYMHDIGHLEFGELHRPIEFDGMSVVRRQYEPDTLDYWVAYWERAFQHVLAHRDSVALLSYEALCARGQEVMPVLADRLGLPASALGDALGDRMRAPRDPGDQAKVRDADLDRRSRALYQQLVDASIFRL